MGREWWEWERWGGSNGSGSDEEGVCEIAVV